MQTVPSALSAARILEGLTTAFVGRNLVYLPETTSTNDEARRLARSGAPEGMLVITEYQTAGRGRLDRRWESPAGDSLLMSLIFRPTLAPHQMARLTMICGLSACEAIDSETGLRTDLKWPNDIMLGSAKVGGILTEMEIVGERVDFAVVGIGLNVNVDPSTFPKDLMMPATSLAHACGRPVTRLSLLWSLLQRVETRYLALESGEQPHEEWANRLVTLHQPVTVSTGGVWLQGVAEGVDADGALLVRLADGRLETVLAGDVTLRAGV